METPEIYGISISCEHRPGVLRDIATVVAAHEVNILIVQQSLIPSGPCTGCASLYFELEGGDDRGGLIADLLYLPAVRDVVTYAPFSRIFGSRVIIMDTWSPMSSWCSSSSGPGCVGPITSPGRISGWRQPCPPGKVISPCRLTSALGPRMSSWRRRRRF